MHGIHEYLHSKLPECVYVEEGAGGLPLLHVRNRYAECSIYAYGAHVVSFKPHGERDLLWLSPYSRFSEGAPIRGGIPLCFPWFGKHRTRDDLPLHGFVRTRFWNLESAEVLADGRTKLVFSVESGESTSESWPYRFRLELSVTVGKMLEMALTVQNLENLPIICEDGFHTYMRVEDLRQCEVTGVDRLEYIDRIQGDTRARQRGPARFEGEMVCAFMHVPPVLELLALGHRRIHIEQENMNSAVLWNPGEKAAAENPEIRDTWKQFVCVESANCLDCQLEIPALGYHRGVLRLSAV
ncbi:MAG: D-hexose-6-phosphate mutarotase, partial [Rectinema sp.]